jgi:hypothetical protein
MRPHALVYTEPGLANLEANNSTTQGLFTSMWGLPPEKQLCVAISLKI